MTKSDVRFVIIVVLSYGLIVHSYQVDYEDNNSKDEERAEEILAPMDGYAILNCDVDFPQDMEIPYSLVWKKDGDAIFSRSDSILVVNGPPRGRISPLLHAVPGMGRGSINITSLKESDGGWYHCIVYFPNRTPRTRNNGTWVHLTVTSGNLILNPPYNQTIMEWKDVILPCTPREAGTKITWYKDGVPLTDLHEILHRSFLGEDGSLTIHSVLISDLGEYTCEATNEYGKKQTASAFINVINKAKVIYTPKEVYLPHGMPGSLDCFYVANPPLIKMEWEKDGILFHPLNVPGVFSRENGSIYFSKITDDHAGMYRCTPYNELGTEGPSARIHVVILRPPVFTIRPMSLYLKRLGESVEIPCEASDGDRDLKPLVTWYKKDESQLPEGRFIIKGGNLTILKIQEEDRGVYQCSAMNKAATVVAETELLVENVPPRAPYNLTAKASNTSVHLKWVAGRKRPRIRYSIWYKPVDVQEWRTKEVQSQDILEAIIDNLTPGVEHEFLVLSDDPQGESIFSKPLKVWTLEENINAPASISADPNKIGAPRNVNLKTIEDGYLLTWEPPKNEGDNMIIYLVKWYQGPSEYLIASTETTETFMKIDSLMEGETYHFEVIAILDGNEQVPSEKITVTISAYGKIQAVAISLTVFVICILLVLFGLYYGKNKFCPNFFTSEKIPENTV
ncbi:protein borderless [Agrilus planipennis]|uniref:Protein borderless n=1 Tax=Agrilus planipennis TaxID=224129 RepID=A0A1W4XW64_AGRPL|nr:protein borderless [Agrilus planipennis]